MFPDLDADILSQMLAFHKGDVEHTIAALLETSADPDPAETRGERNARASHTNATNLDEEYAFALQKELSEEEERKRQTELSSRAVDATVKGVNMIADKTKGFLQRAVGRAVNGPRRHSTR
jgi:hypothetical protein